MLSFCEIIDEVDRGSNTFVETQTLFCLQRVSWKILLSCPQLTCFVAVARL